MKASSMAYQQLDRMLDPMTVSPLDDAVRATWKAYSTVYEKGAVLVQNLGVWWVKLKLDKHLAHQ